jgi:hypothetical protein
MRYLGGVVLAGLIAASQLLGTPAARAAIGPDQARELTTELRDWLRDMAGPTATLPELTVTAEGDHYLLSVPAAALSGPNRDVTAKLRPLDGGRWAADDIRLPADANFIAKMPPRNGQTEPQELHFHLAIAGQDSHGVIDPTMATTSTVVTGLRGIALDTDGDGQHRTQRFDTYDQTLKVQPNAAGKVDIDEDGSAEGWKSAQELPDGRAMAVGAAKLSGTVRIVGLDRAQAATLGPVLSALSSATTPERNDRLRALVLAMHGLLSSVKFDETIEGMQVAVAGQGNAAIDKLHVGFESATPDGNLATSLSLGVDGLVVPPITPSAAALAPKHVKLGVSLAGVSVDGLNKLALAALAPDADAGTLSPQIDAMFADPGHTGGPRVGIDTLAFDLGPAQFDGHGSVVAISQSDVRGTARVSVTGLDALMAKMQDDPQLQSVLPFVFLAKGMARTEGSALIWDIVFTPTGLTVNGIDPRTMLGGQQPKRGKPPTKP